MVFIQEDKAEMKIRKFKKGDALACSRIIRKSIRKNMQTELRKRILNETKPENLIKDRKKQYFVCEDNKKIVGIGALNKKENEVKTMYIHPKFQGKGIGTAILKAVEKEAKKRGIKTLILYTHNPAFKFYLINKYKIIEKFTKEGGGKIYYMEKRLK